MKRTADVGPLACHLAGSGATAYTATHSRLDRSIHVSLSAWRGSLFCLFVAGDSSGSLFFGGVGSWCGAASGGSAVQGCAADSSARPEEENPGEPCKSSDESRPHHSSVKVVDKTGAGRERGRSLGNVGLGFYLCRLIAEAHHGTIELGHRPEWPTCFQLWLSQSSR